MWRHHLLLQTAVIVHHSLQLMPACWPTALQAQAMELSIRGLYQRRKVLATRELSFQVFTGIESRCSCQPYEVGGLRVLRLHLETFKHAQQNLFFVTAILDKSTYDSEPPPMIEDDSLSNYCDWNIFLGHPGLDLDVGEFLDSLQLNNLKDIFEKEQVSSIWGLGNTVFKRAKYIRRGCSLRRGLGMWKMNSKNLLVIKNISL